MVTNATMPIDTASIAIKFVANELKMMTKPLEITRCHAEMVSAMFPLVG